jgi:flavin reductase (DIM6/NTAB) family NADH-FMN oxidoreductase RutF
MPAPAQPAPATPVPADDLAAGLGRIPSGLFVVTWRLDEADRCMLASWVMQAGFDPPLVSVAVGTGRSLLAAARAGVPFAVSILADSQQKLLGRFGKPPAEGEDPFAGLPVERTPAGIVVLADAAGWLECRPAGEATADGADHVVLLGRVEAGGGRPDTASLTHVRRNGLKY